MKYYFNKIFNILTGSSKLEKELKDLKEEIYLERLKNEQLKNSLKELEEKLIDYKLEEKLIILQNKRDSKLIEYEKKIFNLEEKLVKLDEEKVYSSKYDRGDLNYEITQDGLMHMLKYQPNNCLDSKLLTIFSVSCILKLIEESREEIEREAEKFDDVCYFLMVLISFETVEGWRAIEKTIYTQQLKSLEISIPQVEADIEKEIVKIFEKYVVKTVEGLLVKIF